MRNPFLLALAVASLVLSSNEDVLANWEPNPTGNAGALKAQIETGGSYDAHSGNATRIVNDLHVPGALGGYGLDFTRYWNSTHNDYDNKDADWPTDFGFSGWSHSWKWTAEMSTSEPVPIPGSNGESQTYTISITITFPDGHTATYKVSRVHVGHWMVPPTPVGAPFTPSEIANNLPDGGPGVHDHLIKMDPHAAEFWLTRADGGSVHFMGFQAREIYDPHGFMTELRYDAGGRLEYVVEEGGARFLHLHWAHYTAGSVIKSVDTGGYIGFQEVTYDYANTETNALYHMMVLAKVTYGNEPVPATYTYGGCDGAECGGFEYPPLKRADDPHFAGAMTKIKYDYMGGTGCGPWLPPLHQELNIDFVPAQPYAIAAERSDRGTLVSAFGIACDSGHRWESNGLGGQRKFYYGGAANTHLSLGYQLGKLTDFIPGTVPDAQPGNCAQGVPCQRQKFDGHALPVQIWDGRNNQTDQSATFGDESGEPGTINFAGGGTCTYNRVDSTGSLPLDTSRMHNPYNHWLFDKNEYGHITRYTRDQRRRVTRVEYPDTSFETFEYDNNDPNGLNQVTLHRLPSGAVEHNEYYPQTHRLWRKYTSWDGWNGLDDQVEYTYDALERVETMRDGRAIRDNVPYTEKMEYNSRHQITKIHYRPTGENPDPTVQNEYDGYGNRTRVIDEMGHQKVYTYDTFRRCLSQTDYINGPGPDGSNVQTRRWDWIYDRVIDGVAGTRSSLNHTSKEWRVQIEPAFNAAGERRVTARTFDVNNRITSEQKGWIQPPGQIGASNPWHQGPQGIETHSFTYDENGQKSSFTDPLGRLTAYEYNERNRLKKSTEYPVPTSTIPPRVTETLYDFAGNKTLVRFPDTKTQQWPLYDAFGQPRQFIDENNEVTDFNYLGWGPMKKLFEVITYRRKDGSSEIEHQLTQFFPDPLGRPSKTIFPDLSFEESTYEFGQLHTFQTRKKQVKTIVYDARGRETSNSWSAPQAYDETPLAPGINRVWDDAGRLLSLSNIFSAIDYGYDDAGQVKWEGTTVAGSGARKQVGYWRYANGDVAQVTYPSGLTVQRSYTARGQLETVQNGSQHFIDYTYLDDGKVHDQDSGNGTKTTFAYNGRGFIDSVSHVRNSIELAKRTYWRDDRDRILAWEKGVNPSVNPRENGRGDHYKYDDAGQLTNAAYQAGNAHGTVDMPERRDNFSYDALGNRQGLNWVASRGAMVFKRRNNGLNQYFGWENNYPNPPQHWGTEMWYDDYADSPPRAPWLPPGNGVLMGDGWNVAGFNALNQPTEMTSFDYSGSGNWLRFGYDPLGRCVKRWVSSSYDPATSAATFFYFDGWNLVQEGPSADTVGRTYVHGARVDEIVASAPGTGGWLYHHYDARGHCIMLTNAAGNIAELYEYDAFGQPYIYTPNGNLVARKFGSPAGNRFLFTGREWLRDVRVYDFRARLYQPELGRFLQPDPKQFEAGDYNLYRYCHNDPVNHSDPMGLARDWVWDQNRYLQGSSLSANVLLGLDQLRDQIASIQQADSKKDTKKDSTGSNPGTTDQKPATIKRFELDHGISRNLGFYRTTYIVWAYLVRNGNGTAISGAHFDEKIRYSDTRHLYNLYTLTGSFNSDRLGLGKDEYYNNFYWPDGQATINQTIINKTLGEAKFKTTIHADGSYTGDIQEATFH